VIGIAMKNSGAGTVTPPAVGMCPAQQVVLTAPYAAAWRGTGRLLTGTATPVRLRRRIAAAGTTGAFLGATVRSSVPTTALRQFAVTGVPAEHASSTPGDLPPEDPLS
jgi:hypothetical protein